MKRKWIRWTPFWNGQGTVRTVAALGLGKTSITAQAWGRASTAVTKASQPSLSPPSLSPPSLAVVAERAGRQ